MYCKDTTTAHHLLRPTLRSRCIPVSRSRRWHRLNALPHQQELTATGITLEVWMDLCEFANMFLASRLWTQLPSNYSNNLQKKTQVTTEFFFLMPEALLGCLSRICDLHPGEFWQSFHACKNAARSLATNVYARNPLVQMYVYVHISPVASWDHKFLYKHSL